MKGGGSPHATHCAALGCMGSWGLHQDKMSGSRQDLGGKGVRGSRQDLGGKRVRGSRQDLGGKGVWGSRQGADMLSLWCFQQP